MFGEETFARFAVPKRSYFERRRTDCGAASKTQQKAPFLWSNRHIYRNNSESFVPYEESLSHQPADTVISGMNRRRMGEIF